jgi:ABC-2 type transport system permease protein
MTGLIGYYSAQLRTSLVLQFQYRVAMAIWMIGLIIEPVIYLAVWTAVAESSGGMVGTFTAGDFAAYYILLLIVQHFTQIWHMWEYDYLIRQGILSGRMLRPIHPIHRDAAENMAYKVIMAPVAAAAVIVLILIFQPTVTVTLEGVLGFIGALILAAWLAFMLGWAVAMAAFWTTRIMAINQMYFVAMFFFSGQIAPLELLPGVLQTAANVLPFRWMVSFPVEVFMGRLSGSDVLTGFGLQLLWIALSTGLVALAWSRGVRRYSAVGG